MTPANPYRPPDAPLADFEPEPAARSARPISAWVLQALLLLLLLTLAAALCVSAWSLASSSTPIPSPGRHAFSIALRLALAAIFVLIMRGIHRARAWARWVGLAAIVGLGGAWLVFPDATSYANDSQRLGGTLGHYVIMPALVAWWAWAFAFTKKARRYFAPAAASR